MPYRFIPAAMLALAFILSSLQESAPESAKEEILVSAAASLKNAFEEIGKLYEKRTGVRVRLNIGASGLLQKQIEAGAPVDVFASAGSTQMDILKAKGLILPETRRNFAANALVLIVPARSGLRVRSFKDVESPEVRRLAIGNPKTVPAGQYARESLEKVGLWKRLQPRIILAENVRQVLDYVVRGEVEAGIVFASDVSTAHGQAIVAARAPERSHDPILYPIALVKDTAKRGIAQRFVDLALSREGQAILGRHGFLSVR